MLLFLFLLPSLVLGNPSLKIRLNRGGWDFLREAGLRMMEREIPRLQIADVNEKKSIRIKLFDTAIDGMRRPSIHYTLTDHGITMRMEGLNVWGHSTYEFTKWAIIRVRTHGRLDVSLRNVFAEGNVRIHMIDGRPQIAFENCWAGVHEVDLSFTGTSAWFIEIFNDYLNDKVRREINKKACHALHAAIADANAKLRETPLHHELKHGFALNYHFVHMVHNPEYTEVWLAGSVTTGGQTCAIQPQPMDEGPSPGPHMVTIWVSEQLASCVLDSAHSSGVIRGAITKQTDGAEIYLRTSPGSVGIEGTCAGSVFPNLTEKYPNQHLDAVYYSKTSPRLTLNGGASLQSSIGLDLFLHPQAAGKKLASLEINSKSSLFVKTEGTRLSVDVKNTNVDLKELSSEIGEIGFGTRMMFELLIAGLEESRFNQFFQRGIPVPVFRQAAMAIAANPRLSIGNGYVRVDANFRHH